VLPFYFLNITIMDEEIKYIPYGTDEIDYNQFINNAANEVQSYVNQ